MLYTFAAKWSLLKLMLALLLFSGGILQKKGWTASVSSEVESGKASKRPRTSRSGAGEGEGGGRAGGGQGQDREGGSGSGSGSGIRGGGGLSGMTMGSRVTEVEEEETDRSYGSGSSKEMILTPTAAMDLVRSLSLLLPHRS